MLPDQVRKLLILVARLEPSVRAAFILAIGKAAAAVNQTDLQAALTAGDIDRAVAILTIDDKALFPLTEALRNSYLAGMQHGSETVPVSLRAQFGFGGNPRAVEAVKALVTKITGEITQSTVDATRALITTAVNEGVPVAQTSLAIVGRKNPVTGIREGGYLGLDGPRTQQAERVAAMLRDPEKIKDYFNGKTARYTTTDRRFDARVRKAIAAGRGLTAAEAEPITTAHRARLLKNRGLTIARTETLTAARAGEMDGFRALVESGAVAEGRVYRTWLSTSDGRTRPDHVLMNGQEVQGMSQPFTFPDGTQAMFPGDPSLFASPAELIQCRCVQIINVRRPNGNQRA